MEEIENFAQLKAKQIWLEMNKNANTNDYSMDVLRYGLKKIDIIQEKTNNINKTTI